MLSISLHKLPLFCPSQNCETNKILIKDVDGHLETSHKGKCFYCFHDAGKENVFSLRYFAEEGLENGADWIPIRFESSCGGIFFTIGKVIKDSFFLGMYMFSWIPNFLFGVVFSRFLTAILHRGLIIEWLFSSVNFRFLLELFSVWIVFSVF